MREWINPLKSRTPDGIMNDQDPHRGHKNDRRRNGSHWVVQKAGKTYLRIVQNVQLTGSVLKIAQRESPIIGFSEEDA